MPKAAERFRSATNALLPSQWSCIPSLGRWFHTEGKSALPTNSSGSAYFFMGKLSSALGALKVSTRPGPMKKYADPDELVGNADRSSEKSAG